MNNKSVDFVLSWSTFLLTLACLGFLAWFIPENRARFVFLFRSFNVDLPPITQVVLDIPALAFPVAAGVGAVMVLCIQMFVRPKTLTPTLNLLILVVCGMVYLTYREAMFEPMVQVIKSLSGPGVSSLMP